MRNKFKKHPYFLVDNNDVYCRILTETIIDEVKDVCPEISFGYISGIKDILKANPVIVCGDKKFSGHIFWLINILNKKLVLYHLPESNLYFKKFAKKAKLVITAKDIEGYNSYPSAVLLSDVPTQKYMERVWKKERFVSKRGCIGVVGTVVDENLRSKLFNALNLLIEDLDLNIIFISLHGEVEKDIISNIKYSANIRYIAGNEYTAKDLLGIISKIDFLVASDEKGAICAMSVDKPVIGLCGDGILKKFLEGLTQEDIVFDFTKLSSEELYSKIKVAWVHRTALLEQMQKKIAELKRNAEDGVKRLCKEVIEMH